MSEDSRDKAAALAEGMEAAGALIENLEQEVADLRSDLDRAAAALKAAQEKVRSSTSRRRSPTSNSGTPTSSSVSATST
jgi:chromosome segregation ATPase